MLIETLDVTGHRDFDGHEEVVWCEDQASGLKALIALHNTVLGPALGGCRVFPYPSRDEALHDVLRLSRGMTYKSAVANLDLGGGKSVIIGDPHRDKSVALLRAMGQFVDHLDGRYIVAEDSGTNVRDMKIVAETTRHVAGIIDKVNDAGEAISGDPSPSTALGVLAGIRAALDHRFESRSFEGVKIAIQGVGNVGGYLAGYLAREGAQLMIADVDPERVERTLAHVDAAVLDVDRILSAGTDVLCPCALGGVINSVTVPGVRAAIVAGAANNQLATIADGEQLHARGILYAPDYVINAGGVIDISYERAYHRDEVIRHILSVGEILTEIFYRATEEDLPTERIADAMARERLARAAKRTSGGRAADRDGTAPLPTAV